VISDHESILDENLAKNITIGSVESAEQSDRTKESGSAQQDVKYFQKQNDDFTKNNDTKNVSNPNINDDKRSPSFKNILQKISVGVSSKKNLYKNHEEDERPEKRTRISWKDHKAEKKHTSLKKTGFHPEKKNSYQDRKAKGFKDLALERQSEECLEIKSRLRRVEDPRSIKLREKKLQKVREELKKKPKGPLGLSDDVLQNQRLSLKKTPNGKLYHISNAQ